MSATTYAILSDITPDRGTIEYVGSASQVWDRYHETNDEQSKIWAMPGTGHVGQRIHHSNEFVSPDSLVA